MVSGRMPSLWVLRFKTVSSREGPGRTTRCSLHYIIAAEASMCVEEKEVKVAKTDD